MLCKHLWIENMGTFKIAEQFVKIDNLKNNFKCTQKNIQ
jgi:hypothetical protein